MQDLIRWAAKDVDDCEAGIARSEEWAAFYEAEAAKVAFDAEAHAAMCHWAAWHHKAADDGRERLPILEARLKYVGG